MLTLNSIILNFLLPTLNFPSCSRYLFCVWQVGIYLLETGLGKPEFLSEGNARLKKANQLMQILMEYFYDFIIPGECLV